MVDLIVKEVFYPAKFCGIKSHMDNTLCDPQIVKLSMGVLCIHVWKVPRDTGCIFIKQEMSLKNGCSYSR